MQTLQVSLDTRSYPIHIGTDLSVQALLLPHIAGRQVMIVSNTTVAPLYLARYQQALQSAGLAVATCILPDGESYKNLETL
ncbi:MAG: 3-dehydroquinate synthase, partial [Pseudomonadota bacterium]|nr:3-dehydroquinate synthase [Pseudomonadota bacterium]